VYKKIGWLLTTLWVIFIAAFILSRWGNVKLLYPNEMGDFLAGAFAPLAFLWLVIGYFQQGEELKQNTRALELQAEELKNSVEQQKIIAQANLEEIEHLKAQALDAKREREASWKPYFSSETTLLRNKQPGHVMYFRISNHGRTVRHVSAALRCSDNSFEDKSQLNCLDSMDLWTDGTSRNFSLVIPKVQEIVGKHMFIDFTYKNMLGDDGVTTMQALVGEDANGAKLGDFVLTS
jgi:hypothetical protein